ncbi:uncharacterized protein B0T23DRAFT_363679 [Neurospora hispaniola]|uniref:DNA2/NAM7 helicase-like C-terminal domain-containing protein n=1 Tax=Neurospora hispaniola TaxID=588809 RepID=A0AAJ0I1H9_9PEZI|nr:hypothetical protein B0T23DRAFT_363679 [Neurospora hispaniola]
MSATTTSEQGKPATQKFTKKAMPQRLDAVICTNGLSGPFIGGCRKAQPGKKSQLGEKEEKFVLDEKLGSDVDVTVVSHWHNGKSHWYGLTMSFDHSFNNKVNEDAGFGACYQPMISNPDLAKLELRDQYTIVVKLPYNMDEYTISMRDISNSVELPQQIQELSAVTQIDIQLHEGSKFLVEGFGLPFANPGHASDGWINENTPIVGKTDLLGLLSGSRLTLLVAKLELRIEFGRHQPELFRYPFDYPFPKAQKFDIDLFEKMIKENMGERFRPTFKFDNDAQSVCSNTMAHVMDMYWLYNDSCSIRNTKVSAYFVLEKEEPANPDEPIYFAVIRLDQTFRDQYKAHWEHLVKDGTVSLHLGDINGPLLNGQIMERPETLPALLDKHAFAKQVSTAKDAVAKQSLLDLVVKVRVKDEHRSLLKTFDGRAEAEGVFENSVTLDFNISLGDLERKVMAVETFLPGSAACPPETDPEFDSDELNFKMALHRDLMRGTGFFDTLTAPSLSGVIDAMTPGTEASPPTPRPLPVFNFFDLEDKILKQQILEEALPSDRTRLELYGAKRYCNVALVGVPGGTGKTITLSTLTLGGLHCLHGGKVYGSGPTHTAVTNFALRIYANGRKVIDRYNKVVPSTSRRSYPLVVRGYSPKVEVETFTNILKTGIADDTAFKSRNPKNTPRWRLALSPSNWLLAILGSKSLEQSQEAGIVPTLLPEHATCLYKLKEEIDRGDGSVARISQLARGELTWEAYCDGDKVDKHLLEKWLQRIINNADVVMTTPATAQGTWFKQFWEVAKIIAIDEAGCMSKADLCSIWGNTLRPIILAGDVKQLPPTMMELETKDEEGNYANRFGTCGRISALAWLQAAGLPTFRLLRQLRMCKGMFDLANELFYSDYKNMAYGDVCDPAHPSHTVGRAFEQYLLGRDPTLTPSPEGYLWPVFWHMPKTRVDVVGTSKLNRMQVKGALELLNDFVKKFPCASPQDFVVISAHKPNVDYGNRLLKSGLPHLRGMPPVQTADSFQGREGSISVVITGTRSGIIPGFVADENRLNVMLTRQKSGLLIIGDKNVTGVIEGKPKEVQKAEKASKMGKVFYDTNGEKNHSKLKPLRDVIVWIHKKGRILEIKGEEGKNTSKEDDKKLADEEEKLADEEEKLADEEKKLIEEQTANEMQSRVADSITEYDELDWGNLYDLDYYVD